MPYDPDGDPDDFDPNDLDAVNAYLDDPSNRRMWEALGREFRESPKDEQVEALLRLLPAAVARRDEIAARIADANLPAGDTLHRLHMACADEVDRIAERIEELLGPPPDHL